MKILTELLENTLEIFLLLAPFLLFGLFLAGILHICISKQRITEFMGDQGLKGVISASLFGIPLPICSCGIIPVCIALRRKGASLPAIQSFLISTPETGVDSIFVTWGVLGPVMAIVRPVASFFSAIWAGILTIGLIRSDDKPLGPLSNSEKFHPKQECECKGHGHDFDYDPNYVGLKKLLRSAKWGFASAWYDLRSWRLLNNWYKPDIMGHSYTPPRRKAPNVNEVPEFSSVFSKMARHSCVELLDDLALPLILGIILSGAIITFFPSDLAEYGLGEGFLSYFIMLMAGVPIYMCATASTPIAAGLVAKGISPGAALVFLLTGPATNLASISMLYKQFGSRFISVYLSSIAFASLICGVAFDFLLIKAGWEIIPALEPQVQDSWSIVMWLSAAFLTGLLIWRFTQGALGSGIKNLMGNIQPFFIASADLFLSVFKDMGISPKRLRSRSGFMAAFLLIFLYLALGFTSVPPGSRGYGRVFGKVVWNDLKPGLHYAPPWPFGAMDVYSIESVRRYVVGVNRDMTVEANRAPVSPGGRTAAVSWHQTGSWKNSKTGQAEFLTGDENLLNMLFVIQYTITNGYTYFYRVEDPERILSKYLQAVAREYAATSGIDPLLNYQRTDLENFTRYHLQEHLDPSKIFTDARGPDRGRSKHQKHRHKGDSNLVPDSHTDHGIYNSPFYKKGGDKGHLQDHGKLPETAHEAENKEVPGEGKSVVDITQRTEIVEKRLGVKIIALSLVDVHPPIEAATAFRDVSSAKEDRETYRLQGVKYHTQIIPRAKGNAALEKMVARAKADSEIAMAQGKTSSLLAQAKVVKHNRSILQDLLWFESSERALEEKQIFILPKGITPQDLVIWRRNGNQPRSDGPVIQKEKENEPSKNN